jgi:hypothetical protein
MIISTRANVHFVNLSIGSRRHFKATDNSRSPDDHFYKGQHQIESRCLHFIPTLSIHNFTSSINFYEK